MTTETRTAQCNAPLFMAMELGSTTWKLAFATTRGGPPRVKTIRAGDMPRVCDEIAKMQHRFGLDASAPVRSCYEAGRDGFWIHRALVVQGIDNVVVDPSSIAVDRRARRAKTDRIDAIALVTQLMNAAAGDRRGWRPVRVPSVQAEADRQVSREWETVSRDRTRVRNRIQGLLITQGVRVRLTRRVLAQLPALRIWDGSALPAELATRLEREGAHLQAIEKRLDTLRALRTARVETATDRVAVQTRKLAQLRGLSIPTGIVLSSELFAWRQFQNGRQVGSCVGLTPTPYRSDQHVREQGISRSGTGRVRTLSIELAWNWIRWQPQSALTRWFQARFGQHGRARRIGIVALARKLIIALWRYVETDAVPEGVVLKAA